MKQTWRYMDYDYAVDTEDPSSYHRILRDMAEYNDVYDLLDLYIQEEVGGGVEVFLMLLCDGADSTVSCILDGFASWMEKDMDEVRSVVEELAVLVEEVGE